MHNLYSVTEISIKEFETFSEYVVRKYRSIKRTALMANIPWRVQEIFYKKLSTYL